MLLYATAIEKKLAILELYVLILKIRYKLSYGLFIGSFLLTHLHRDLQSQLHDIFILLILGACHFFGEVRGDKVGTKVLSFSICEELKNWI